MEVRLCALKKGGTWSSVCTTLLCRPLAYCMRRAEVELEGGDGDCHAGTSASSLRVHAPTLPERDGSFDAMAVRFSQRGVGRTFPSPLSLPFATPTADFPQLGSTDSGSKIGLLALPWHARG